MPDPISSSPIVEDDDGGDFELIHLEEGQEVPEESEPLEAEPDEVKLSKADYEALLRKQDSTLELTQGLKSLGEVLQRPQTPTPANVPQMPAFDAEAIEEEAFKPKGFASAVEKVVAARLGGLQAGMAQALQAENKARLRLDPSTKDTFVMYEKEIEQRVQSLPPEYRFNPTIYEQVHKQVMLEHLDEITEKKALAMVEQKLAEALEKAGIAKETPAKKPAPMYQENALRGVSTKPKQKVYFTSADRDDLVSSGGNPDDKIQVAAYLAAKYAKGRK